MHLVSHRGWAPLVAWQRAAVAYGHRPTFWDRALDASFSALTRR
jgi:hypothetical protein